MRILILGANYAPEAVGIGVYTSGMAEALAAMGHTVEVVAGKPYYPAWRIAAGHAPFFYSRTTEAGVRVTRCPLYVPKTPTGARRLLHHLSFAFTAFFAVVPALLRRPPDIVIAISPSLLSVPLALIGARACGAKAWLHVHDFEIEAAVATGLIPVSARLASLVNRPVSWLFRRFDVVSTISAQMCAGLRAKGVAPARIVELNNWASADVSAAPAGSSTFRKQWGIAAPHVVLYAGTIANKQGLEIVVEAARLLVARRDILFVICGAGPRRTSLALLAADLPNVMFRSLQPPEELNALLALATLHVLPQLGTIADLLLPSKLGNMLASGRPVIATTAPGTGLAQEIAGCGLSTQPGDAGALAAAVVRLVGDAGLRRELGAAAGRRAESHWNSRVILARLEARLRAVVAHRPGAALAAPSSAPPAE